ncbi:MAG TPA: hypothetical protein VH116_07130 [Gemmatimonadales bacterium]|nr:hypothetical protein [Gemmatimonadales bacterium]
MTPRIANTVLVAAFAGAAVLGLALTPLVRRAALARGVLDIPDERKVHTTPVPRLGGLGVALATGLALLGALAASPALRGALFGGGGGARWAALGIAALVVLFAGAVDDVRGVPAEGKLLLEIGAAALVVTVVAPRAVVLTPSTQPLALGALAVPLAVLWIVTLTNAVNLTDVADGVAGGIGVVSALALGLASLALGRVVATAALLGLAGALLGFLPHNFRWPRIFLGDSGSLFVGFLLGSASLIGLERDGVWLAAPAVLAVGVPLAECGLTVTRRLLRALAVVRPGSSRERFLLRRGRAGLFVPDRRHVPHRLLELGLGRWTALAVLYGVAIGCGALAVAAVRWPAVGLPAVLLAFAGLLYAAPRWLYEELRLLDRGAFLPLLEMRVVHNHVAQLLYDGATVAVALLVSAGLGGGGTRAGGPPFWAVTGVVIIATLAGFRVAGLYRGGYRDAGLAETARAFRAIVVGGVLGTGAAFAALGAPLPAATCVLFVFFLLTLVGGARFSFRVLEYVYQRGQRAGRRALIVGADRAGRHALAEMLARPELGLRPVGFVDDTEAVGGPVGDFQGYPLYAGRERLTAMLTMLAVSDLVVPAGTLSQSRLAAVRAVCQAHAVRLVHFDVRWDAGEARVAPRHPPDTTAAPAARAVPLDAVS